MRTEQNNTKKTAIALIALLVAVLAVLGLYRLTKSGISEGEKNLVIEVVHGNGTSKTFEVRTDREYLGEALKDAHLAEGTEGPYGLYITAADAETADDSKQEWWCLTKDGGQLNTSADQTPIADGEKYELTLTTGW